MTVVHRATRVCTRGPDVPFLIMPRGTGPSRMGCFGVMGGRHDIPNIEQNACATDLTKDRDDIEASIE
jgi:hypothetical protein